MVTVLSDWIVLDFPALRRDVGVGRAAAPNLFCLRGLVARLRRPSRLAFRLQPRQLPLSNPATWSFTPRRLLAWPPLRLFAWRPLRRHSAGNQHKSRVQKKNHPHCLDEPSRYGDLMTMMWGSMHASSCDKLHSIFILLPHPTHPQKMRREL